MVTEKDREESRYDFHEKAHIAFQSSVLTAEPGKLYCKAVPVEYSRQEREFIVKRMYTCPAQPEYLIIEFHKYGQRAYEWGKNAFIERDDAVKAAIEMSKKEIERLEKDLKKHREFIRKEESGN